MLRPPAAALAFQDDGAVGPHERGPVDPHIPWTGEIDRRNRGGMASVIGVQVNTDAEGNNRLGDAANEPTIAVDPTDPRRIVIGWRQFDNVASNYRLAGVAWSRDSGRSWHAGVLHPTEFRTDPVLDTDPDGDFYYHSLFGTALRACDVYKSTDGGQTWSPPVRAGGGDKNWMAVDHTAGIGSGNIYTVWRADISCCGSNIFNRSTDGGITFIPPVPVPASPALGTISAGPDGAVYVGGVLISNRSAFRIARSLNARDPSQTPSFTTVSVNLGGTLGFFSGGPNPDGLLGQVWVATDHSGGPTHGYVYMLCSVDPAGTDPMDVHFVRSTDGGLTWSPPIRVNHDEPAGANAWQWFGTLSVAPNGRIDVVWCDTRNTGLVNLSELFYSSSTDAGLTWAPGAGLTPAFDSHIGWPNQRKLGDYYHMVSDNVGVNLAYAATFNGEQDIYFLRIGDYDCNGNGVGDSTDIAAGASIDCNANGIPDECEYLTRPLGCDVNCDGSINQFDIQPMIDALSGSGSPCSSCAGDANADGSVNQFDIGPFLDCMAG